MGKMTVRDRTLLTMIMEWPAFQARVKTLPPELLEAAEDDLREKLRPCDLLQRIKISFWDEYNRAQRDGDLMRQNSVVNGVCTLPTFHTKTRDPLAVAWVISPPVSQMIVRKQLIKLGFDRLREVMDLPLYEEKVRFIRGKKGEPPAPHMYKVVNVPLIKEIRTIIEMMENRVEGGIVQRAQIHQVNEQMEASAVSLNNVEEIDKLLERLSTVKKAAGLLPAETVDVEVERADES